MSDEKFKFPTDQYYVFMNGYSERVTHYYDNTTINSSKHWNRRRLNTINIFDKSDVIDGKGMLGVYFIGPFADILQAKIYTIKKRKYTLSKIIENSLINQDPSKCTDERKMEYIISVRGEIKKVNTLIKKYAELIPEHFI